MKTGPITAIILGIVYFIYSLINRKKIITPNIIEKNIIEKELFFEVQLYFSLILSCLTVLYGLMMFKFNLPNGLIFILIFINGIVYKLFICLCKWKKWIKLN